ncbi:MAG: GNAT family N-acetyltransferase [Gammaproteobacteria bacterium]|nr:GNAT family N-acetyltransferase [Gammaproteobacteria bacterium]
MFNTALKKSYEDSFTIRPLVYKDVFNLRRMFKHMSAKTLREFFLYTRKAPGISEIKGLYSKIAARGGGCVVLPAHGEDEIAAFAYYVSQWNESFAEPAVVVNEAYQNRGAGNRALRYLIGHASSRGVPCFKLLIDPYNVKAKRLVNACGLAYSYEISKGEEEITLPLGGVKSAYN